MEILFYKTQIITKGANLFTLKKGNGRVNEGVLMYTFCKSKSNALLLQSVLGFSSMVKTALILVEKQMH